MYTYSTNTIQTTIGNKESNITPKYPDSIEINKGIPFRNLDKSIIFVTENKKKNIKISFGVIDNSKGINTFVSAPPIELVK